MNRSSVRLFIRLDTFSRDLGPGWLSSVCRSAVIREKQQRGRNQNTISAHLHASSGDPGDVVIKGGGSRGGTFKIKHGRLFCDFLEQCVRRSGFKNLLIKCRLQVLTGLMLKQHSSQCLKRHAISLMDVDLWPLTSLLSLFSVSVPVWLWNEYYF